MMIKIFWWKMKLQSVRESKTVLTGKKKDMSLWEKREMVNSHIR